MDRKVIIGGMLSETGGPGEVVVEDGVISVSNGGAVDGEAIDASGLVLFPGSIDVHCHGAVGVDVNEADTDGLIEVGRYLASQGVTAWLPTLVPDSDANYARVIGEIDRLMEIQDELPIAQALGVHYEGVFASEKMCGALRPEYFKRFSGSEIDTLPTLKRGRHMTTFAPEVEGGVDLAAELTRRGWIASIGHTRAEVDVLDRAFDAGARHVTHFFNAMTGIHHRDVGVAGWALTRPGLTFDIIADGIHVHPSMLKLAIRHRSVGEVLLISDSIAPTGLDDGRFELWGETIEVQKGRTRNERGSIAGSVISMRDAMKTVRAIGFSDSEIALMSSSNPARLLGEIERRGSIRRGMRADLVGLDANCDVRLVMIGGRVTKMTV